MLKEEEEEEEDKMMERCPPDELSSVAAVVEPTDSAPVMLSESEPGLIVDPATNERLQMTRDPVTDELLMPVAAGAAAAHVRAVDAHLLTLSDLVASAQCFARAPAPGPNSSVGPAVDSEPCVIFRTRWGKASWLVEYSGRYDNDRPPHVEVGADLADSVAPG